VPKPIRPRNLAKHAKRLAGHRSEATGRAVVTWLRRSTSASYYAVFHAIALSMASQIAPNAPDEDRYRFTRSVEHGKIAEVCRWVVTGGGKENVAPIVARLRQNPQIVEIADAFLALLQARHQADYDHLAKVTKATALGHYRQAVNVLDLLDTLDRTRDLEDFLALIALNTPLR